MTQGHTKWFAGDSPIRSQVTRAASRYNQGMECSPCPGMDPYLERHWRDVHGSLVIYARDALNEQLGGELVARCDERLVIEQSDASRRDIHPDGRVVEHGLGDMPVRPLGGVAVAELLVVEVPDEPVTERFVNIIDPSTGGRVVTSVELLSPTNKLPGDGREQYLLKQRECAAAGVSLVEVDLVRKGLWTVAVPRGLLSPDLGNDSVTCVRRSWMPLRYEVYRMPLRDRLPAIRVPLRGGDADVVLDLQALLDRSYRSAGYGRTINYRSDPIPPLDADDAAWADALLRDAGRR
jgi:hypothetical protein